MFGFGKKEKHEMYESHEGCNGNSQTIILKIEGMTCGHCQASVEKALKSVSGVTEAKVNLARREAVVKGSVDREKLVQAVEDAGYMVV